MKEFSGLDYEKRFAFFCHSNLVMLHIYESLRPRFSDYKMHATSNKDELEDIFFYGSDNRDRLIKTLPTLVITNLLMNNKEKDSVNKIERCNKVSRLTNVYNVPLIRFNYTKEDKNGLYQSTLSDIITRIEQIIR